MKKRERYSTKKIQIQSWKTPVFESLETTLQDGSQQSS